MPGGKGLFSSFAEKAQHAISSSSLGAKLTKQETAAQEGAPSAVPGNNAQSPVTHAAGTEQSGSLTGKHHGLEALQHQIRSLQAQYTSGASQESRQIQLIITAQKGVSLDYDAVNRDAKAQSKAFFLWGQTQADDIKDVTDRLAYLNYVHGALSYTLATEIEKSRQAWKNIRDAEAELAPRRKQRADFKAQIQKFQNDGGRTGNVDVKIQQLHEQLAKAEADDAPLERELELLRRTTIKESEAYKWKALKEYGQKLILLAGASEQLLQVLPNSPVEQYTGAQQTAAVRAALQRALDSGHLPATEHLPLNTGHASAEDTRSFGETHADELSSIATVTSHSRAASPAPPAIHAPQPHHATSNPINPAALNHTPASIPPPATTLYSPPSAAPLKSIHDETPPTSYHAPEAAPHSYVAPKIPPPGIPPPAVQRVLTPPPSTSSVPIAPTVAETGIPLVAKAEGPGPNHGNIATLHKDTKDSEKDEERIRPSVGYGVGSPDTEHGAGQLPPVYGEPPSANSLPPPPEGGLVASGSIRRPEHHYESAEDEKKRLEREERERILAQSTTEKKGTGPDAPPAYAD